MSDEPAKSEDEVPSGASAPIGGVHQRTQSVFLRHESEIFAMGGRQRLKTKIASVFCRICFRRPEAGVVTEGHGGDVEQGGVKQYRLEATRKTEQTCYDRLFCCLCRGGGAAHGIRVTPNKAIAQSLHWMFRVNFVFLFALSCIAFFALTFLFAGFIVWAAKLDKDCVRVGSQPFEFTKSSFADAFALSWTTFSTVGYGSVYPALGNENDSSSNCAFITAICSLESFIGVLYSGFCGAILFGKVLRIQSHAQVIFSDPIVVRYGSGVESYPVDEPGAETEATQQKRIPCPVLEFRIVNRLFNDIGGEIMDATLHAVANLDAGDTDSSDRSAVGRPNRFTNSGRETGSFTDSFGRSERGFWSRSDSGSTSFMGSFRNKRVFFKGKSSRDIQTIDEDPSARLVGKRIFSKMLIEASEHPFFKRVWLARHVLDDMSPLLTHKMRRAILRNEGFWPSKLNNYEDVRNSLHFSQIIVSLNGVSNVSAADVYAQKTYDIVDVNIGYQFVNVLYRDGKDGVLKVDTTLVNDVKEQDGGGGEPLMLGQ